MEKVDAGKSTPKELVRLRQEGMSDKEVARMVGLPVQTTSEYYSRYKKEGEAFFKVKPAGRPKSTGKRLSDQEEASIVTMLVTTNPGQLQFSFAL